MILHRLYRRFSAAAASSAVLTYHRIADEAWDPDGVCVPPFIFEQQLQFLTRHFQVIPLWQLIDAWMRGKMKRNTVALSFDDGYADNFITALPLLEHYGMPATFFITNRSSFFWWDVLKAGLMNMKSIEQIRTVASGCKVSISSRPDKELLREEVYHLLAEKMKTANEKERNSLLHCIDGGEAGKLPPLMDAETLAILAAKPGMDIGGHTASHPMLSTLSPAAIREELLLNKRYLEERINRTVHLLAYPFGNYNAAVIQQAKELGYSAAVTTHHHSFRYAPSPFEIGRYNMGREVSPAFLLSMKR